MARLLPSLPTVVATSRSTALVTLVLAGAAMSARVATADSINLLRPAAVTAPVILFDQSRGPWKSDDEATAPLDKDCVAVNDRARDRKPAIVYVVCVDHPRAGRMAGGMQFSAALSWSAQPPPFRRDSFAAAVGVRPIRHQASHHRLDLRTPRRRGRRANRTLLAGSSTRVCGPIDLPIDLPIAQPITPPSSRSSGAGGNGSGAAGPIDGTIVLAPEEVIPPAENRKSMAREV